MSYGTYSAAREINSTIILHPEFERVCDAAEHMVEMAHRTGVPSGIIITADPGMGKTEVLNRIARKMRMSQGDIVPESPMVRMQFDSMVDQHKLGDIFMEAMGYPSIPGRASLDAKTRMIDMALEKKKPRVGLIDEGQHVCEGCRDITARAVTDWLKIRMDKHQLTLVMAGTKVLGRIREINPQFVSRVSADYVINRFGMGPAWKQLIGGFVQKVKLIDLSILNEPKITKLVHEGTIGNLRRFKKWMTASSHHAERNGRIAVTVDDLRAGYLEAFGASALPPNPFGEEE